MIWVAGRVVADDALRISALDRTFEHGLGLFETFRTWNGRPVLLDRHLARLSRSARELGLPLDPSALPDADAVASLLRAEGVAGDVVLRITLTGGTSPTGGSVLWMRSAPLPPPPRAGGAVVVRSTLRVDPDDRLARHKTLNYWARRLAYEEARAAGADEALLTGAGPFTDLALEGSRTNLFVVIDETLITLGAAAPILPGVMRSIVLDRAPRIGLPVEEREWRPFQAGVVPAEWISTGAAEEVFLTNSVRGIIPVGRACDFDYPAPGSWTRRLWEDVRAWLDSGRVRP
jgi:branched-chain amino acid aminotransferase